MFLSGGFIAFSIPAAALVSLEIIDGIWWAALSFDSRERSDAISRANCLLVFDQFKGKLPSALRRYCWRRKIQNAKLANHIQKALEPFIPYIAADRLAKD